MGEVFLAREQFTERRVAMKFLRAAAGWTAQERFLVEVRALAALDHPNIVRVLATDFLRADPFFTMELATGGTLARWVEEHGPVDPAEAARVVAAVARAVAAAHAAGILHRDLKPSNILLHAPPGSAELPTLSEYATKVSDFGLAKRLDHDDLLTPGTGTLGTPGFMPPEQISRKNGEISPASDTYGLGATLFSLLTGKPPFGPGDPAEVMHQVLTDPVPRVRAARPEVLPELEGIVVKCLEKDQADRYPTAAALADDLDRFLAGQKPVAPPLTRWRRARRWAARHRTRIGGALLVAALVLGAFVLAKFLGPSADPEAAYLARARADLARGKTVTLIGASGRPAYYHWRVGQGEVVPLAEGDDTFSFLARDYAFLELFPDPGIDCYAVSAEIQHVQTAGALAATPLPGLHPVGLYFAHDLQPGPGDTRVHTFGLITYSDFLDPGVPHCEIFCRDSILHERGLQTTIERSFPVGLSAKRERVGALPGPWRRFEIVVTPDGFDVSNGPRFAGRDAAGLQTRSETLQRWADEHVPGVRLAGWSARRPFGVWVLGSWVAVRKVTITPLPPPNSRGA
jgi:serine/threonine-protein kinase